MLKVLLKDPIKTPGKLLALCIVMYLATVSFFVAAFLVLLTGRWLYKAMQNKTRAIEAAEKEAEAARVEAEKLAAIARTAEAARAAAAAASTTGATGTTGATTGTAAANDSSAAEPAARRYAKSAVVIPFRTGTL